METEVTQTFLNLKTVLIGAGGFAALATLGLFAVALFLRKVVPTNEVHIVQSAKRTTSFGKDLGNGNTYYAWPSWVPVIGVTMVRLPTSVFDLDLDGYEAYDQGRLPFNVDVKAFFRIADPNVAAQRVASFAELMGQLKAIVQGAVRVILASNDIEAILQGRATFGEQFTREVAEQLAHWGVCTVKNIELMDIRDSANNSVIKNIMEKKKSHIEMESRTEVAKNKRTAEIAEIEARREVDLQKQQVNQAVGLRTIEAEQAVALQKEAALQIVTDQQKTTKQKEMEVLSVQEVRGAEIEKNTQVIKAQQAKETAILAAEAQKETAILTAEGKLQAKERESKGIALEGQAHAEAEKALQLAPVQAQITLAKEIGDNKGYQDYLVTIRRIEAEQAVGVKQAEALGHADVKVIANSGNAPAGLNSVMDVFSSKGGTALGSTLEGLANTPTGKAVLNALGVETPVEATPAPKTKANGKLLNGNGSHA
jgi:flotillin